MHVSSRSADAKLIAGATVAVLFVGFLIAGAILVATRGADSPVCPELNIGSAAGIRSGLEQGGPYPQTGGGGCTFWLALADGEIVAYRARQPEDCTLRWRRDHWECGGQRVETAGLAEYPVTIRTVGGIDAVFVDLRVRPVPTAPTTTATSSLPRP
jgi:hypothetical protein